MVNRLVQSHDATPVASEYVDQHVLVAWNGRPGHAAVSWTGHDSSYPIVAGRNLCAVVIANQTLPSMERNA